MSVEELVEAGLRAQEQGDSRTAMRSFQQALEIQKTAENWLLLAEAQIDLGSFARAHRSLSAGLLLEGDNTDLLFALADLYLEEERYDQAITIYLKIVSLDTEEAEAWVSMAVAQLNGGDLDAAEQSCYRALKIDAQSAFGHNILGDIYVAGGNKEGALECFQRALELDSSDPQACLSLAELYYDAGDLEQAEKYCQRGLELDAGLPLGYLTLGYIYLDQDQTQAAIDNFQQFLRLEKSPAAKNICDEVSAVITGLQ